MIYTIEGVKPIEILPNLPTYDTFEKCGQSPLLVFKTLAKESENYIKTSGDPLMCDSLLVSNNYVAFTDKKVIVMGVENFGDKVSFALGIKQVRYLNKFLKCEIAEYLVDSDNLILIYENGLKLFLPIIRKDLIEKNVERFKGVLRRCESSDWIALPDFKPIKISTLLANKQLDFIRLTNETIEGKDLKINFNEYEEINFDKVFKMKVPINCFKLILTLSNYISLKNNFVSFINSNSTIFGTMGTILDD